ncbi:type II secretion system protein GspM [Pseudoduganella sp. UC29_106]|uniref:type II secretion system protein GspM n=1 Tax=Pseudoduganella sp. UC29_106 TaxID=3374553 RepID=UPI00375777FE
MKALWVRLSARIDALSLRERVMVCGAGIAIVLFIIYQLALAPLLARQQVLRANLSQHQSRAAAVDAEITTRMAAFSANPDVAALEQIADLKKQTAALQSSLQAVQRGLVPPQKMAALLGQLMRANSKLRTVSVRTLPVSGLSEMTAAARAPVVTAAAPGTPKPRELLYRHGVELVVQGGYLDMLSYMESLQALPSQLFWGRVQLDADNYPTATLTLTLYTLSLDDKWMTL